MISLVNRERKEAAQVHKGKSKKNILISAFIGSKNLGDEAIFRSILNGLEFLTTNITAVSINEAQTQEFGVKTVFAKNVVSLGRAIRSCDLLLLGGGGIIQDQSSILNFFYYSFQITLAKIFKKPVVLCFVGVGPINYRLSKYILSKLISTISYAVVRDERSKNILVEYGMKKQRVYQAHDPVLNFPFEESDLTLQDNRDPYAVIALRRWFFTISFLPVFMTRKINKIKVFRKKYDEFINKLSSDIDEYLEEHPRMRIFAVSFYDGEDTEVNNDVKRLLNNKDRFILFKTDMDEFEYLSIIKNAKFLIGMRLHSLILSSTLSKPFVALRYSPKVDEFTKQFSLMDYSIHVEDYNSEKFKESLRAMTKNCQHYEKQVNKKLGVYQEKNRKAFKVLNEKIEKLLSS